MLYKSICSIALCLVVSSILGCTANVDETITAKQPNIVFILADDLGSRTLSMDGNPIMETPNLDHLASQGMKFNRGYASATTCKPSRAAIMTGQYAPRTKIYRVADKHTAQQAKDVIRYQVPLNSDHLALESITLAETLKNAGYSTGFFGKWHLESYRTRAGYPDTQGFDVSYEGHRVHYGETINKKEKLSKDTYVGDYMTDKALEYIEDAASKKQPFFVYLPYYLIHRPLEAKPEDIAYFENKLGKDYDKDTIAVAAMTKALDDSVGRVLAKLTELGLDDNTLVVFTSDNGGYKMKDNILNGDLRLWKGDIYEGGLRVPYIFRFPGKIAAASQSDEPIIGVDLYPTIMNFAKATKPEQPLDGVDLGGLLTGKQDKLDARSLYWFYPKWEGYHKGNKAWRHAWRNAINDGQYKLIQYPDTDKVELYDLLIDPNEKKDISKKEVAIAQRLEKDLNQWKVDISAHKEIVNPDFMKHLDVVSVK